MSHSKKESLALFIARRARNSSRSVGGPTTGTSSLSFSWHRRWYEEEKEEDEKEEWIDSRKTAMVPRHAVFLSVRQYEKDLVFS